MKFSYIYLHFLVLNNLDIFLHLFTFFSLKQLFKIFLLLSTLSSLKQPWNFPISNFIYFLVLNDLEIFLHLSTFFSLESPWNFYLQYVRISCLFYFLTPSQSLVTDAFLIEIVRCIYAYMLAICVPIFVFRRRSCWIFMSMRVIENVGYLKIFILEISAGPDGGFGKLNIHRTKRKTFGRLYSRIQIIEISASSLNIRMSEDFRS